ncbi:nuclear transport factor 2 family protein [bacterium]|jgi:hypothetical protein|nr:nuclear transport factor 2 family protein [bacterium]
MPQKRRTIRITDIETSVRAAGTPPEVMDAVMARYFKAEAAHDRAGILAALTENAEHEPVGFPGAPFHSHDELMGFYEELEQLAIAPVRRLHGHNFLVDEVQYGGRAYNDFMGFEFDPEVKSVDFRLLHVCEFEGDRISRE